MKNENGYVVISMNSQKVGYYLYCEWLFGQKPTFVPNHFLPFEPTLERAKDYWASKCKIYKSKQYAKKIAKKISAYYNDKPTIVTKVISLQDWLNHWECEDMEKLFF